MDFRFDDEQIALRDAIRAVGERHFSLDTVGTREGVHIADATWSTLSDMGVFAMLLPADVGGIGGGVVEAALIFEQLGAHLATGPLRWSAAASPLLVRSIGEGYAAGAMRIAGLDATSSMTPHVIEHALESDLIVVLHDDRVERCAPNTFDLTAGTPLDPLTPAAFCTTLPQGELIGDAADAQQLRAVGAILATAELVGVAQGALTVAAAYAKERQQFGVPIGSFQAVKHLLADMFVRVELARSTLYAAAAIFDDPRAGDLALAISSAKLLAGEAGIMNGKTAVQILGGMGFTWEMLPHYFLKRAWVLEESFGTADTHALALSDALAAGLSSRADIGEVA